MGRDFEQELKQLQQTEIPDLWSRIEAGLTEKTDAAPVSGSVGVSDRREGSGRRTDREKKAAYRKWGTLAACLCLAAAFPVLILQTGKNGGWMSGLEDAADMADETAVQEDFDTAEAAEEPEDGFAAAGGPGTADSFADMEEAGTADSFADTGEERTAGSFAGAGETADRKKMTDSTERSESRAESASVSDSVQEPAAEESGQAEDSCLAAPADGQILSGVTVQVTAVETVNGQMVYRALILQSDEGLVLEKGTEIEMTEDDLTDYSSFGKEQEEKPLKEGGCYEVSLRCEERGQAGNSPAGQGRRFVIVSAVIPKTNLDSSHIIYYDK